MLGRRTSGAVLCPSCGKLVGVRDPECLNCGRRNPGMWGFAGSLGALGRAMEFTPAAMWACGLLYLLSIGLDPAGLAGGGLFSLLGPTKRSLFVLGASGAYPVFVFGRWWTPLSAGWLHAGALHILFNMLWLRDLGPLVAHLYGTSRSILIYTAAAVAGFVASSVAGFYLAGIPLVGGAGFTVGASASIFGLIGALLHYGRRGGSQLIASHARSWALGGLLFGFLMPGVDNWAHLGGLAAGYLASLALDPLRPERGTHVLLALLCLLASGAAVAASFVIGLPR